MANTCIFFYKVIFSDFAYTTWLTRQLTPQFIYGSLKSDIVHRHRGIHGLGQLGQHTQIKKKGWVG